MIGLSRWGKVSSTFPLQFRIPYSAIGIILKCDAIKQNESELEKMKDLVFNCIVCIILRAIFC